MSLDELESEWQRVKQSESHHEDTKGTKFI
jgi:hypothetical protein